MSIDPDLAIRDLAARQHGVVSRRQLRDLDVPSGVVERRVRSGVLTRESGRVLRLAGAPSTRSSLLMAAVLDAGPDAAVSHRTASRQWGMDGFPSRPVEVTGRRPRVSHGRHPLAVVHQPRRLLAGHVVEIDGIPVTTPSRTIFDLASLPGIHPEKVERILDTMWSRNLVNHASLDRVLREIGRRGRTGTALMRSLLIDRGRSYQPPGSSLERRFQEVAAGVGFREFERQVDVGDEDGWIGRVDFLERERRLIVEVDPAPFHTSLTDQRNDQRRHADLHAAGWTVVSITDEDLFYRPHLLRDRLRAAAGRR